MATIRGQSATPGDVDIQLPNPNGRADAAGSRPVALSTEDLAALQAAAVPFGPQDAAGSVPVTASTEDQTIAMATKAAAEAIAAAVNDNTTPAPITSTPPTTDAFTIASGEAVSDSKLVAGKLAGLILPAAWTAAGIALQFSTDDMNWFYPFTVDGGQIGVIAAADAQAARWFVLDLIDFIGPLYVRVCSQTLGSDVPQAAERSIVAVMAG